MEAIGSARVDRRDFLKWSGLATLTVGGLAACSHQAPEGKADYTLHISPAQVETAPGKIVSTTTYNGQFPGPLLRFTEGKHTTVDVHNDTVTPQQLHWHGQRLPVDIDGSAEEGTPFIAAHGMRRISFVPGPSGFRFYHTHLNPGADLIGGQYGGLVGPVYIEPKTERGAYDRQVFLTLKEFGPTLSQGGDMPGGFLAGDAVPELKDRGEQAMDASLAAGTPHGYEVGYDIYTVNGRILGHGDPIRVKTGDRVLLHILNGSATENRSLALPGHSFTVVALDGNPVPKPVAVNVLWLGAAERISAIVEMSNPGVWILGDLSDDDRQAGMGAVVEYAGRTGNPQWAPPPLPTPQWDYRVFGAGDTAPGADHVIDLLFEKRNAASNGFNVWTINGVAFSMDTKQPVLDVVRGQRYRLRFRNATDDIHPMHPSPAHVRDHPCRRHAYRRRSQGCSAARRLPDDGGGLRGRPTRVVAIALPPANTHGLRFHDAAALHLNLQTVESESDIGLVSWQEVWQEAGLCGNSSGPRCDCTSCITPPMTRCTARGSARY